VHDALRVDRTAGYDKGLAGARRIIPVSDLGLKSKCPRKYARRGALAALALLGAPWLAGCSNFSETLSRGYVLQQGALEQIPIGATQEQVLIVLGTPSTVATVNGQAFYYISQKSQRAAAFMPYEVRDQRVIAVYFDKDRRVERLANYTMKDGKIFDTVSQTTPTGGNDFNYLQGVFNAFNPRL
jgi:outer membrane protein assembly factor BamE (lipoprotein component of BamABCDE complex)